MCLYSGLVRPKKKIFAPGQSQLCYSTVSYTLPIILEFNNILYFFSVLSIKVIIPIDCLTSVNRQKNMLHTTYKRATIVTAITNDHT